MLFADLPVPAQAPRVAPPVQAQATPKRRRLARLWEQLALPMVLRALERDEDTPWDFPVHQAVSAASRPAPETRAPRSVFDLARAAVGHLGAGLAGDAWPAQAPAPYRVEREFGRVRVVRIRPEDTPEWQERERARRARQRPPKPVRKARTRSKKLLEMIGPDPDA